MDLIKTYADMIVKIEAESTGKIDNRRKEFIERQFKNHILNLDSLLLRLKIPVVMYLRVHAKMNTPLRLHWLATSSAVNAFTDWMESEAAKRFENTEDLHEYVRLLASWESDAMKRLLEEWHMGDAYVNSLIDSSFYLDKPAIALMEMDDLPGSYLLTVEEVMELYNTQALPTNIRAKIELSLQQVGGWNSDMHKRFIAEVSRRCAHGAMS